MLAAAMVSSIGSVIGRNLTKEDLVYMVSQVEQVLTTGGGWQDQVGAIYGGFKMAQSPNNLPIEVIVEPIEASSSFASTFEKRTYLIFTGQQRLAKNTLINALRKCSLMPVDSSGVGSSTVSRLIQGARKGFAMLQSSAQLNDFQGDKVVDSLCRILNDYWALKKEMAAGSEPAYIKNIFRRIAPITEGVSLCGAGAGGYAVVILKGTSSLSELQSYVNDINSEIDASQDSLTIHKVRVDFSGITNTLHQNDPSKDVCSYLN